MVLLSLAQFSFDTQAQVVSNVTLECDDGAGSTGEYLMDVRPGEYEDVEITCTITNTYQLPEEISFQIDEDNSTGDFSYDISPEGPYQLAAGEEQVVVVSVRGSQGMEADTSAYTVQMTATVDSVGTEPVVVPVGALGSTDTESSEVKIEWYHNYDFSLDNGCTESFKSGQDVIIPFTITKKSNIEGANHNTLIKLHETMDKSSTSFENFEKAGISLTDTGNQRVLSNMKIGETQRDSFTIVAPETAPNKMDITFYISMWATPDDDYENDGFQQFSCKITLEKDESNAALGAIESFSSDDVEMYSIFAGGAVLFIIILVVLAKVIRKGSTSSKSKLITEDEIEEEIEEVFDIDDDDFDFEDLDDDELESDFDFEDL
tara:strand:- start:1215 stop:2342 length:1128 start_codon:yes stop_codon:yes gene_type:complete